jgi:hypothetical protein
MHRHFCLLIPYILQMAFQVVSYAIINWSYCLYAFAKLRKATLSFITSVRSYLCLSAWNNAAHTEWIFVKFDSGLFIENLLRKFKFHYNLTRRTGNFHEDLYTFYDYNSLYSSCNEKCFKRHIVEKIRTHILYSVTFF